MTYIRPITASAFVTANVTAAFNEIVQYDPSGGTFTITAPTSPVRGDTFAIKNITDDKTAITVSGGAAQIEGIGTELTAATQTISGDGISIRWVFNGSEWNIS